MDGFFLGGRNLPWWAVSGSIMASQISAVTIIARARGDLPRRRQPALPAGHPARLRGGQVPDGLGLREAVLRAEDLQPLRLHRAPARGRRRRTCRAGLFLVSAILGHGVRLLTVALVLSVVVEIPIGQSVLIIGVFAVLWTLMGGITTVIWTDFVLFVRDAGRGGDLAGGDHRRAAVRHRGGGPAARRGRQAEADRRRRRPGQDVDRLDRADLLHHFRAGAELGRPGHHPADDVLPGLQGGPQGGARVAGDRGLQPADVGGRARGVALLPAPRRSMPRPPPSSPSNRAGPTPTSSSTSCRWA